MGGTNSQRTVIPFQSHRRSPGTTGQASSSRSSSRRVAIRSGARLDRQRDGNTANRPRRNRSLSPLLYLMRLLIVGVGIGVLVGSLLSNWDPASHSTAGVSQTAAQKLVSQQSTGAAQSAGVEALKLTEEILPLKTEIQTLAAQQADLLPGVFMVDLDTGNYVEVNGANTFSAASMIKFPILVAFFQDLDAGKVRLEEPLVMEPQLVASGSGTMQFRTPGTRFTALETATKMITISDNTATNMIIQRLGGMAELNRRFQTWGMTGTILRNPLPDLEGTNTTRPQDMAHLMAQVSQGAIISLRSRDRLLHIMGRTETDTLLPRGLDQEASIAHKTGDIGSLVGDVGVVDAPNGKRYVAVAMVRRPHNDNRAQELIRQISRASYKVFGQTLPLTGGQDPATSPVPAASQTQPQMSPSNPPESEP
ncbi:MAG: serine hydrolase [Leptolyngbyaceae cyanobacterium bins.59]|nr:serine hydrolase [Leptolyngbyaceae cyanobacterium bins.59]